MCFKRNGDSCSPFYHLSSVSQPGSIVGTTTLTCALTTTWMSTVLTTKTQCLRSGQSAMSSTWSTMMATPRATTPPRASSVGNATGRTRRTDRSSSQRSSSSSLPSPWALSSDRDENTTISVSHDCFVHSIQSEGREYV